MRLFFISGCQLLQHCLLQRLPSPHQIAWTFVKNLLVLLVQVYFCFFLFFNSVQLIYVSVPLPVRHSLLYRSAVISFKIYWKFKLIPPILLSFFPNWVALVPLPFSINFQIILFMPTKKAYADFDRNWIKSL